MSNEADNTPIQNAIAAACSTDLPEAIKIMATNNDVDTDTLEEELRQQVKFMEMVWVDAKAGGQLYKTMYSGVTYEQIISAGRPGTHAEVLAVNEVIKALKEAGKFHSAEDLKKISVMAKEGDLNLARCVHCFYLLQGVKTVGFD
ncbi:hypothetical protein SAMN05518672_11462 [Chitinophaga sp. CF118]|uniref:hypothetical protein n=1 Tax=Chitinophaga sp. CF118 TaxID=1884367 RepID=UPI0008E0AF36|nr:hypothetical protein [Chitinophaga sp. CF118]SFF01608.1 hypothetical protein SAMN05518672_11462 [Chitinophaga sp. CF118]